MLDPQDLSSHSQLRLAESMNAAAPAVWDWDAETRHFLASDRVYKIYGFPKETQLSFAKFLSATHNLDAGWADDLLRGTANPQQGDTYSYRILRADTGEVRWIAAHVVAAFKPGGSKTPVAYTGTIEDITAQTRATHALMESEARLRLAIEAGKMAVWEVDLETGTLTNSPQLNHLFGLPLDAKPTLGDLRSLYAPGELARLEKEGVATLEAVRARFFRGEFKARQEVSATAGEDRTQVQAELAIVVPSGLKKRLLYRAQYAFSLEGRPQITGLLVDITERKLAEERLATVARELQHRVKNSLAVVQALAAQSFRSPTDAEAAVRAFLDRLQALAAATNIILDSDSSAAELFDIVSSITRPYRLGEVDPFSVKGPGRQVSGKVGTALGMILHELSTNAVKHGALSIPSGRVLLQWRPAADGKLLIDWEETGGPEPQPSPTQGFGTRLLKALVAVELGGSLEMHYEPTGLKCHISMPDSHS